MAKKIMLQGTSSGAGKTTIALALCRIFHQDGFKVAPFKSQNVTSNTSKTKNGDEIAISQLLQAYAAGAEPSAQMNPVVLNMSGGEGTQVILNGKPYGRVNSQELSEMKIPVLLPEILKAYESLDEQYDIIVIEGAGSPVELNLNTNDIVNMGIATRLDAPVLLIGDIDRGGVFASLYGTIALYTDEERALVKGTIVNRFKGDLQRFEDGKALLESICKIPVAGVIPYIDIDLPEEDDLVARPAGPVLQNTALTDSTPFAPEFDRIAEIIRQALDMELIYRIINNE
ncbi:MAG: cobyric acid synthase [Oscillospiraceae bacterium]|nr:cobyric acid synthase [Oscillospiraceae bacterium]